MALSYPATAQTFDKVAWRLLPLLFVCYIVAFLDRVNVGFAKLQMAGAFQWSDATYGFGAGIFFIGYFMFEVPANLLLERVGARRWIARIMITWAMVSGGFAFLDVIPWGPLPALFGVERTAFSFYALRFLLGVAEAGFFPGIILYLTFWFPMARRAQTVSIFMTAIAVANVVGGPLSGWIMEHFDGRAGWGGWQWLFVLECLPSLIMGVVVFFRLPNGPQDARWLTDEEKRAIQVALELDRTARAETTTTRHTVRDTFRDWRVFVLAVVCFCGAVPLYGVNFWMPTIIQEFGIPKGDYLRVGLLSAIPWGCAGVAMVLIGKSSDRRNERRWHVAGTLICSATGMFLLAALKHQQVASMIGLTLVAIGVLGQMGCFWSLPTLFLRGSAAAAGIAFINSIGNLGGHFGPDLIGRLREATGGNTGAFLTVGAIAVVGAILTVIVAPRTPDAGERTSAG
ncbi:MAG: MFS transporter [Gemmatimonadaceae bacterium]|nr:MFS transporter [Gemmatimonadaceae bacterium]